MGRILVVEDEPNNRVIATTILRNVGHTVEAVTTGKEALEALERADFDLVLMDVLIPVMDGIAATRAIRQHPARRTADSRLDSKGGRRGSTGDA